VATGTVSAPLAQLPNALTILRLVLIPVFVVLYLRAGDGSSWASSPTRLPTG
jgi:phosphatidylglycerophosphate synthase